MASPPAVNGSATAMNMPKRKQTLTQSMHQVNLSVDHHHGLSQSPPGFYHHQPLPAQPLSPPLMSNNAHSPDSNRGRSGSYVEPPPRQLTTFVPTAKTGEVIQEEESTTVNVLLLENLNETGINLLRNQGFNVETEKGSLGEEELISRLQKGKYQVLGIRSKTKVTRKVVEAATSLLAIGCFCIGTNQVDLSAAAQAGIAVFNSPFSNSRSVAELVMAEVISLSRQLCDRVNEMRQGNWNKVSKNCWEIRNKTLGIIGYGHIGSQLSVLAEAFAMDVLYYDVIPLMPLGSASQTETLEELLANSDFVTLHVPELPETINMIGAKELSQMKKGAYLINNARGKVVDLPALVESLKSGHLAGAAVDVFPAEPAGNGNYFDDSLNSFASELCSLPNVMLTPHIGGSTEEAQRMIGTEVGSALVRYVNFGSSLGAVNFPEVNLKPIIGPGIIRLCHIHLNQPGVLKQINAILGEFNVERQLSESKGPIAYLMADIADVKKEDVKEMYDDILATRANVATRILF